MTLPNSPELNPLDYSIWDCISNRISYEKVETSDDLRRKIRCKLRTGHNRCLPLSIEKHNDELIFDEHS